MLLLQIATYNKRIILFIRFTYSWYFCGDLTRYPRKAGLSLCRAGYLILMEKSGRPAKTGRLATLVGSYIVEDPIRCHACCLLSTFTMPSKYKIFSLVPLMHCNAPLMIPTICSISPHSGKVHWIGLQHRFNQPINNCCCLSIN